MKTEEIKKYLPDGFNILSGGKQLIIFSAGWEKEIKELGARSREQLETKFPEAERLRGRGTPLVLETGKGKLVIRHYCHGGLMRRLTRDIFSGPDRPLQELAIAAFARAQGVNAPEPLGLIVRNIGAGLIRADLVTRYVPESLDLLDYARNWPARPSPAQLREKREIISRVAALVSRMHRAGICHGDLQLKNILLVKVPGHWDALILDLDKARQRKTLLPRDIMKNLLRFHRSFQKIRMANVHLSARDSLRFLRAYAPRDKKFRRYVAQETVKRRLVYRLHALRWKLSLKCKGDVYARPFGE